MRHGKFGRKLSRDTKARKALLANVASSMIEHGKITTTVAKAKFAQSYIEKLITSAQKNNLNASRHLSSKLTKGAFLKLVNEIGPGFVDRKGGYTRIIRVIPRRGDRAKMATLEFVEWDKTKSKIKLEKKESKSIKTTNVKPKVKRKEKSAKVPKTENKPKARPSRTKSKKTKKK